MKYGRICGGCVAKTTGNTMITNGYQRKYVICQALGLTFFLTNLLVLTVYVCDMYVSYYFIGSGCGIILWS